MQVIAFDYGLDTATTGQFILHLTRREIVAFLDGAKKGEFDHLVES